MCARRAELIREALVALLLLLELGALLAVVEFRGANGRRSMLAKLVNRVGELVDVFDSFALLLLLVDAIVGMLFDVLMSGAITDEEFVCVDCTL